MAIVRKTTLTAERQTTDDLTLFTINAPTISSTIANTGTYSYRSGNLTSAFGRNIGTQSAVRIGYYLYHNGVTAGGLPNLFVLGNGTDVEESTLIRVEWDEASGNLLIRRCTDNNTYETLATASVPAALLATSTQIHLGLAYYAHATNGFLTVYVNGTPALSLTGDTRPSAWNGVGGGGTDQIFATTFTNFWVSGRVFTTAGSFASFAYADDIYVDSYDSEVDAAVPQRIFLERICNIAGVDAEFTPLSSTNVSQIDDGAPNGGPNDGDTTYNKAEAADLRDTFGFDDITLPDGYRVVAVIPFAHCKTLDVGPEISLHLWDGANYSDGSDQAPTASYTIELFERFTAMPDASTFSEANVNGLQIGYKSAGVY